MMLPFSLPTGQFPQTDAFSNTKNHYTDACLNGAAGGSTAGLDFYQMHTYDWGGYWSDNAPFTVRILNIFTFIIYTITL